MQGKKAKKVSLLSIMLALILVIGLLEKIIPFDSVVPGVKLGLSNAVVLISVYIFDFSSSFILVFLKCVLIFLVTGNMTSFIYSLSGSLLSFFVMFFLVRLTKNKLSPVGISVAGAFCHNLGQIFAAAFLMGSINVVNYLPILAISGVVTGIIVGFTVKYSLPHIKV